jgi:hypothetical protein
VRYGFDDVGLGRIIAQTMTVDTASRAVMERVGLTYVRTFPTSTTAPVEGIEEGEVEYERHASSGSAYDRTRNARRSARSGSGEPPSYPGAARPAPTTLDHRMIAPWDKVRGDERVAVGLDQLDC